ncbi:hypothetical protein [uncultured Gemmiger sp.]|uniref:hypothetical protein n=1 Tax=uncultured Gemmiger sp. TaxID=1623490 RepID=UPI00266583E8|nr:hypothetical protein [uncultured Gemmiger sp.]
MIRYEFIAMRGGAPFKTLNVPADCTPQIKFTGSAEVKSTISLTVEPDNDVDWLTDMLSVVRVNNVERTPIGLFNITTSPVSVDDYGHSTQELTGYDQGYFLRNLSVLERSLTIRAGTKYTTAIREQLLAAGIAVVSIVETNDVLMTDHAWETGSTRYSVVSDLLSEINYRDIYFDGRGVAIAEPWQPASINSKTHRYGKEEVTLLRIPMNIQADTFDAANVFVDIVSSADLDRELRAVAENVNPTSPLSLMRRGRRIVSVQTVEGIASQEALETHVKNRMLLSMMGAASYTFTTCGDVEYPHGLNDSILMMRDGIGLMEEQDWSLSCIPGGQMTHTAKKVYFSVD